MVGVDAYTTHYVDSYGYGSNTVGGRGQIENYGWTNATYNSLLTINYDWHINEDWGLNAVVGNEIIQSNRKKYYEYGTNYNFPGWNHINNATTQQTEEETWKNRTVGFFGNVSASYRNMLYLTLTGRQDYVSNMPRNNRSFFYPSISAGFILTELDALKNNIVDILRPDWIEAKSEFMRVGMNLTTVGEQFASTGRRSQRHFNWTKIDNYVDELAPGVENISLGGYVTPQVRASAGEKFPVIYGVGFKRDANGNRLVDENGLPIAGEAQVIGKVSPDFLMGFNTTLRLWKCTISAVLDWKQGGQMYSRTTGLADYYGVSKRTEYRR